MNPEIDYGLGVIILSKNGFVKPNSIVQKYYTVLFSLPKIGALIISVIVLIILNIAVYVFFSNTVYIATYIIYAYIIQVIIFIVMTISYLRIIKSPLLTFKRLLGILVFYLIMAFVWSVIYVVTSQVNIKSIILTNFFIASMMFSLSIGIHGFSKKNIFTGLTYVSAITYAPLIIIIFFNGVRELTSLILYITPYYIITIISGLVMYTYLSRYKYRGLSIIELGKLFLLNWLQRARDVEKIFGFKEEEIEVHIVKGSNFLVLYPDIHYGPFSNIGSSMLPYILRKSLASNNIGAIVLHGMGSHDRNLVSFTEANKLVKNIVSLVKDADKGTRVYVGKPFRVEYKEWSSLVIPFTQFTLVFLSRSNGGIDDIPYRVQEYALRKSLSHGVPSLILIDSHNCEKYREMNIDDLYKLIDKVIQEYVSRGPCFTDKFYIGFSVKKINDELRKVGVLDDIVFLSISTGEISTGIVYIPGNNMVPGFRDRILKSVKELGYTFVEVVTNDEHTATGIMPRLVYLPVQESSQLLYTIRELAVKALSNVSRDELKYYVFTMKTVLMGNSVWKLLGLLKKTFYKVLYLHLFYIFVFPLVIFIIMTIL